ncbi:Protein-disulfide isomerase [Actinacidiphila yanglinensis]|uniref:Protein-disulfide isomerase n=1 Tax=Actinacidiphila yanglinensis TaxID=310779 RepID=A0A1H5TPA0_9ACTN|nr:thioredoxin domain-containing protein [Actinacidiphila yanglinensis]SEF64682.1 Protein-disulfide isomerase [Actinacidiphila yanglinensis]
MSEKNRNGKVSARQALQAQREKDKARAKRKRTLTVAGGVVVVIAIAAGISIAVANSGSGKSSGSDSAGTVTAPRGAIGKDNLVIPVGAADAPSTLTIYEDFRCPACDAFEKSFTPTIHGLEDSGAMRTEYHLVTLIDGNLGGDGSLNAANAAACAQDAGKFRAYHDVLYANQPDEQDDKFGDKKNLLTLAGKVPGLRTAAFTACVDNGTHNAWVKKSNDAFNTAGFNSTPTVLLNGKNIYSNAALTPALLKTMVEAANKGKKPGTVTATPSPS